MQDNLEYSEENQKKIIIHDLKKNYARNVKTGSGLISVLESITLDINQYEFVTFFGPNGCGKTTLLYIIAALLEGDEGKVRIFGHSPHEARMGFIFQNYRDSLLPWRTGLKNIMLALENLKMNSKEQREKTLKLTKDLGLNVPLDVFPYQLSGGQQQLLAILRALVAEPEVLVMDEPFGSLDYTTRYHMQDILLKIWSKKRTTVLFVSHEIDEAIYLADRIVLLSNKPTRILNILHNDLPRPRNHNVFETKKFNELKVTALRTFRETVDYEK